jgi:hypothetical protein
MDWFTENRQALGHSLSGDVGSDGIFIPPVPGELMQAELTGFCREKSIKINPQ